MRLKVGDIVEIIINGKSRKISLNKKIGEGTEGKVYQIDDNTYKIYYPGALHDGFESKEKIHSYLINILTEQIILPTNLIYNKFNRYIGYTAPPIENKRIKLIDIETKKFIQNLKILENDIQKLSNNKVLMVDVKHYNFIYNGTMYIIDPGKYKIKYDEDTQLIHQQNLEKYKKLILYLVENEMHAINFGPSKTEKTINLIKKETNLELYEYFSLEIKKYETLKEYVKHKH